MRRAELLTRRFSLSGELADLETAETLQRQALLGLDAAIAVRARSISSLGDILFAKFKSSRTDGDLDQAIAVTRRAESCA